MPAQLHKPKHGYVLSEFTQATVRREQNFTDFPVPFHTAFDVASPQHRYHREWPCDDIIAPCMHYSTLVGDWNIAIRMSVCLSTLSVSPHVYLKNRTSKLTKFSIHAAVASGSVSYLWRRCSALCTSGFVDDVIFSYNGHYGSVTLLKQLAAMLFIAMTSLLCGTVMDNAVGCYAYGNMFCWL